MTWVTAHLTPAAVSRCVEWTAAKQAFKVEHMVKDKWYDRHSSSEAVDLMGRLGEMAAVTAFGLDYGVLNWEIGHAGDSGADFNAFGLTWDAKTSTLTDLIFDNAAAFKSDAAVLVQMMGDRRHPIDAVYRVGGVCSRGRFMAESTPHDYGHGERLRLQFGQLLPVRQFLDAALIRTSWTKLSENDPVGTTESCEKVSPNV
jgi:hypothetical protein